MFFVAYEGKRRRLPVDIVPGLDLQKSIFPSKYHSFFGPANSEFNEDLSFAKINVQPTDKDLIEISGKYRKEGGFNLGSGSTEAEAVSSTNTKEKRDMVRSEHNDDTRINDLTISSEYFLEC